MTIATATSLLSVLILLEFVFVNQPAYGASQEAVNRNNAGVKAIFDHNFPEAIKQLNAALSSDPSYRLARQNLAIAHNNLGLELQSKPDEAIKHLHMSYYIDGMTNATTRNNIAGMLSRLKTNPNSFSDRVKFANQAYQSGDIVGAIVEYDEALRIHYDPATAAFLKKIQQNYENSRPQNKSEVKMPEPAAYCPPDSLTAAHAAVNLNNAGVGELNNHHFSVAIANFNMALTADSSYQLARENLAIAHNNLALELQADPHEAIKHFHIAYLLQDMQNAVTRQNIDGIIKMMKKDPQSSADRIQLANEASSNYDLPGAIVEYSEALKIQNDPATAAQLETAWTNYQQSLPPPSTQTMLGYMKLVDHMVKTNWHPPFSNQTARTVLSFHLDSTGVISNTQIEQSSGNADQDQAALKALSDTGTVTRPYFRFPDKGAKVIFTFDYHVAPAFRQITTQSLFLATPWVSRAVIIAQGQDAASQASYRGFLQRQSEVVRHYMAGRVPLSTKEVQEMVEASQISHDVMPVIVP